MSKRTLTIALKEWFENTPHAASDYMVWVFGGRVSITHAARNRAPFAATILNPDGSIRMRPEARRTPHQVKLALADVSYSRVGDAHMRNEAEGGDPKMIEHLIMHHGLHREQQRLYQESLNHHYSDRFDG